MQASKRTMLQCVQVSVYKNSAIYIFGSPSPHENWGREICADLLRSVFMNIAGGNYAYFPYYYANNHFDDNHQRLTLLPLRVGFS